MFGENHLSVHDDVEDPAAALDEFRFDTGVLLDRIRQTGGLRQVVSLHAIGDGNFRHAMCLLLRVSIENIQSTKSETNPKYECPKRSRMSDVLSI